MGARRRRSQKNISGVDRPLAGCLPEDQTPRFINGLEDALEGLVRPRDLDPARQSRRRAPASRRGSPKSPALSIQTSSCCAIAAASASNTIVRRDVASGRRAEVGRRIERIRPGATRN